MGVRKRERELLLQLEEKRNHYQDADASYKAGLRSMFVERDKGNEIEARRLLREIFLPAQDHYNQCQRDFFIGFAKLLCVKAERMEDFARRISELVFEANCDGFSRGEMPYHRQPHTLIQAESALRSALGAMAGLSEVERARIGNILWLHKKGYKGEGATEIGEYVRNNGGRWMNGLSELANAAATAVGVGSMTPADDELEVNRENWALLNFIRRLWRLVHEYDGKLNYSRTRGKGGGSLMTVLRLLQPVLPNGMLENPPYGAIENLIDTEKKKSPIYYDGIV